MRPRPNSPRRPRDLDVAAARRPRRRLGDSGGRSPSRPVRASLLRGRRFLPSHPEARGTRLPCRSPGRPWPGVRPFVQPVRSPGSQRTPSQSAPPTPRCAPPSSGNFPVPCERARCPADPISTRAPPLDQPAKKTSRRGDEPPVPARHSSRRSPRWHAACSSPRGSWASTCPACPSLERNADDGSWSSSAPLRVKAGTPSGTFR